MPPRRPVPKRRHTKELTNDLKNRPTFLKNGEPYSMVGKTFDQIAEDVDDLTAEILRDLAKQFMAIDKPNEAFEALEAIKFLRANFDRIHRLISEWD